MSHTPQGRYRHWEMQRPGLGKGQRLQVFKCPGCDGETVHPDGWNGEPDVHNCKPGCPCREGGWSPGQHPGARYRSEYDRIFGKKPHLDKGID